MQTLAERAAAHQCTRVRPEPASAAHLTLTSEVRAYVARHRSALAALLVPSDPSSGGEALGERHAKVFDGLLASVHARVAAQRSVAHALAAVGSYGRGAMALASDLDVRFLVAPHDRARGGELAEAVLYPLWDGGLTIGHQLVEVEELLELARTDLPTATSLLDWRHLAGDAARSEDLATRARSSLFGDAGIAAFVDRLEGEVVGRHERFGGSVYLLEPDVRNGPGALRDLDVIGWMARARWGVSSAAGLLRYGVLVQREATELAAARELLWRVRNRLHAAAGRRSDRLTFDLQERMAPELGYGDGGAAVEAFMSDYYRAARCVSQVRELVTRRARPVVGRRRPHEELVGGGLVSFDQQLTFDSPSRLADDPAVAFRLYAEAIARQRPVFAAARDAVTRATQDPAWVEELRRSVEAARLFVELATTARETQFFRRSVLGELHDVGLLVAMIPEFSPVVGRVHHDVYHVYTVDVHSVAAVDRLRALARGDAELAAEYPLACRLAAEASRPRVLYLATLLHDVGKDIGGKGHAERGAELVEAICPRLGLPAGETAAVAHLVRVHLAMYHLATRRDLDDPSTVEELLRATPDAEALRELFLLTVADLSTTSPTALTVWKSKLLEELYLAADRALGGGAPSAHAALDARGAVRAVAGDREGLEAFLSAVPTRYLLSSDPQAVVAHFEVAARATPTLPAVSLRPLDHGMHELAVVMPDRPGLLAAIAAALVAARLEVHAAQIHSYQRANGATYALDLFRVRGPGADPRQLEHSQRMLERELAAMLAGARSPNEVATARGKPTWAERATPAVETRVSIDDRGSQRHGIIEVITRDRPGVLFALARALHELGLSIALAKINTEGTRVADVFYVTRGDGEKPALRARQDEIERGIVAALTQLS